MTAADLARLVHASHAGPHMSRLMPSSVHAKARNRVTAHDLAHRLRIERGLRCTEALVLDLLSELAGYGCVDRGEGGWAVCNWERLGEVGEGSTIEIPKVKRAMR